MVLPQAAKCGDFEQACHSKKDDCGQNWLRQIAQQSGEKQRHQQDDRGCDQSRKRSASAATLVHERLRHATADWEGLSQPCREIGPGEREELLVTVEAVAVF